MFRVTDRHARYPMTPPTRRRRGGLLQKVGLGLAAAVGGSALLTREMTATARATHPPRGKFRTIGGVRLNYIEQGSGPAVVLIHGNGVFYDDWIFSGVLDSLSRDHRVIAVSRPGFGYSTRSRGVSWTAQRQGAVIAGLMDLLGIERATVVGHSWGTLVATAMAIHDPARVSGLVLIGGYFYPTARPDVPLFSPPGLPGIGDVLRYTFAAPIGALLLPFLAGKVFVPRAVPQRFIERFPTSLALVPSHLQAVGEDTAIMIQEARRLSPYYGQITVPMAVMWGAGDEVSTPARQSERFVRETDAIGVPVPGFGHMVHWDNADRVAALVAQVETAPSRSVTRDAAASGRVAVQAST